LRLSGTRALLITEAPTESASAKVRVVHEALFDGWDRAKDLLERSRDRRTQLKRLQSYCEHWMLRGKVEDELLSSASDLELAESLRHTLSGSVSATLTAYIDASIAWAQRRDAERLHMQTVARRRRNVAIAVLSGGVIALSLALYYARQETSAALRSQFSLLVKEAERSVERGDTTTGMLIALAARDLIGDDPIRVAADSVLLKGVAENRELEVYAGNGNQDVSVAFASDGSWLAVPNGSSVEVRELGNRATPPVTLRTRAVPIKVAVSADSRSIGAILSGGEVAIWLKSDVDQWKPQGVPSNLGKVQEISFDAASDRVIVLSEGNELRAWHLGQQPLADSPVVPRDWPARQVVLSPDSRYLTSVDARGTLEIWLLGKSSLELTYRQASVGTHTRPAFSNGGRRIAWARADGSVEVWDRLAKEGPFVFRGLSTPATAIAFDSDGRYLASASADGSIASWDLERRNMGPRLLRGHQAAVVSIAFLGQGQSLVSASLDGSLRLWSLASEGFDSTVLRGHSGGIATVSVDPRGNFIATAGVDGTARLWSARGGQVQQRLESQATRLNQATFSSNGDAIIAGAIDGHAWLWRRHATGWKATALPVTRPSAVWRAFVSGADGIAGAATLDGEVRFWDLGSGEPRLKLSARHYGPITGLAHSRDYRYVVTSSDDGTAGVWSTKHLEKAEQFLRHGAKVRSIAIDDSALSLLTIEETGGVIHWARGADGVFASRKLYSFAADGTEPETNVVISGSGKVAAASLGRLIVVWREGPDGPATRLPSASSAVWNLALTDDSRLLAASTFGGEINVWDLQVPSAPPVRLAGHRSTASMVAFDHSGKRLVSAGFDGRVALWDLRSGTPLLTMFDGHHGRVMSVEFDPTGRSVLSAGEDGSAMIWPAIYDNELATLASRNAPRCLSATQLEKNGLRANAAALECRWPAR
jgi:WD40 repeat protein